METYYSVGHDSDAQDKEVLLPGDSGEVSDSVVHNSTIETKDGMIHGEAFECNDSVVHDVANNSIVHDNAMEACDSTLRDKAIESDNCAVNANAVAEIDMCNVVSDKLADEVSGLCSSANEIDVAELEAGLDIQIRVIDLTMEETDTVVEDTKLVEVDDNDNDEDRENLTRPTLPDPGAKSLLTSKYIHRGKSRWCCRLCNKKFQKVYNLRLHIFYDHLHGVVCSPTTGNETMVNSKYKDFVQILDDGFACTICGREYSTMDPLRKHIYRHLKSSNSSIISEMISPPSLNDNDDATTSGKSVKSKYKEFVQILDTGFACTICRRKYSEMDPLRKHIYRHLKSPSSIIESKSKKKIIKIDDATPSDKSLNTKYKDFMQILENGFACSICSREYHSMDLLRKHIYRHLKSLNSSITPKSKRKKAKSDHATGKPVNSKYKEFMQILENGFACSICSRECRSMNILRKHVSRHLKSSNPAAFTSRGRPGNQLEEIYRYKVETETGFKCAECGQEYRKWESLRVHIIRRHVKKSIDTLIKVPMKVSSDLLPTGEPKQANEEYVEVRISDYSKEEADHYICTICKSICPSVQCMIDHLKGHITSGSADESQLAEYSCEDEGGVKCKICQEIFDDRNRLRYHIKWHLNSQKYEIRVRCEYCAYVLNQKNLDKHVWTHHLQTLPDKFCEICTSEVAASRYKEHMRSHRRKKEACRNGRTVEFCPKLCDKCGLILKSNRSLILHMKSHMFSFSQCPICKKQFLSVNLAKHMEFHNTERFKSPAKRICEYCGKIFFSQHCLKQHINTQHLRRTTVTKRRKSSKIYACMKCPKVYTSLSSLNYHLNWHAGVKPHVCSHCGKGFNSKGSLRAHSIVHTDNKPFECSFCDKAFRFKGALLRHECTHTGDRPYCCEVCGRRFIQQTMLVRHRCKPDSHGNVKRATVTSNALTSLPKVEIQALEQTAASASENSCAFQTFHYEPLSSSQMDSMYTQPCSKDLRQMDSMYTQPCSKEYQIPETLLVSSDIHSTSAPSAQEFRLDSDPSCSRSLESSVVEPAEVGYYSTTMTDPLASLRNTDGRRKIERLDPSLFQPLSASKSSPIKPAERPSVPVSGEDAFQDFIRQRAYGSPDVNETMPGVSFVRLSDVSDIVMEDSEVEHESDDAQGQKDDAILHHEEMCSENVQDVDNDVNGAVAKRVLRKRSMGKDFVVETDIVNEDKAELNDRDSDPDYDDEVERGDASTDNDKDEFSTDDDDDKGGYYVLGIGACAQSGDNDDDSDTTFIAVSSQAEDDSIDDRNAITAENSSDEVFMCEICEETFKGKDFLSLHRLDHPELGSQTVCAVCNKVFQSKRRLRDHLLVHTDEKPISCPHCPSRFRTHSALKSHSRKHTDERPYKCDICGSDFKFRGNLRNHVQTHRQTSEFVCDICGKDFKVKDVFQRHRKFHTSDRSPVKKVTCSVCSLDLSSPWALKKHMVSHSEDRPFICSSCGNGFKTLDHLQRHEESVHRNNNERLPCTFEGCTGTFSGRDSLQRHIRRVHERKKPARSACQYCDQTFGDRRDLKRHEGRHFNIFRHPCLVCDKGFDKRKDLERHMNVHEKRRLKSKAKNARDSRSTLSDKSTSVF